MNGRINAIAAVTCLLLLSRFRGCQGGKARSSNGSFLRDVVRGVEQGQEMIERNLAPFIRRDLDSMLMEKAVPLEELNSKLIADGREPLHVPDKSSGNNSNNHLPRKRRHQRRLEDGQDDDKNDDGDDYYLDADAMNSFDGYSLKFATCQPVQRFSEDAVKSGEYSALIKDDIVILRLCPKNLCSEKTQYGCASGYGEYAIGINDYLTAMMHYEKEKEANVCAFCEDCANEQGRRARRRKLDEAVDDDNDQGGDDGGGGDDDNDDFYAYDDDGGDDGGGNDDNDDGGDDGGGAANDDGAANDYYAGGDDDGAEVDDAVQQSDCYVYQSYCENYDDVCGDNDDDGDDVLDYEDYINYFGCVKIEGYDDNSGNEYFWVNPYCSSDQTIAMGLFYDPYCSTNAANEVDLIEFSGIPFDDDVFKTAYSGECLVCEYSNDPPFYDSNQYMCNKIYSVSAKCNTYLAYDFYESGNDESLTCSFIESIRFGTYDVSGDIYTGFTQDPAMQAKVTPAQIVGLVFVSLFVIFLSVYSCYLHHAITNLLLKSLSQTHMSSSDRRRSRDRGHRHRDKENREKGQDDWDHGSSKPVRAIT